ncbi:MAG: DNA cytosine methyltransferase [Armatimonadetes bacterium]|nr:DNA cytosine methyltransferase [Armatimonadota bacterium]
MMNAIDLYSGVGGWRLGLGALGVDVVRSYERWAPANATHGLNFGAAPPCIDIRAMTHAELPDPGTIDFVVGSPPCTQFSFANRGGNGDLEDGLVDVRRFLEVVRHLRPRAWAMENVPRVAGILSTELGAGGRLSEFRDLVGSIEVVDVSEFGLPQARRRMVAGSFDGNLLLSYRGQCPTPTLGQILASLAIDPVHDPNWGLAVGADKLTDHILEAPLTAEETRMNRDAKTHHTVYNSMSFPDRLDRPSRTVTATCTRVSRESIVIPVGSGFRRLTVRERAVLQGFPITFQFAGDTYSDKIKMVGNAIPPVLAFYVAQALQEIPPEAVLTLPEAGYRHRPFAYGVSTPPESRTRQHTSNRSFRYAIPGLRFRSGVRFEMKNVFIDGMTEWRIALLYGTSKNIIEGNLSGERIRACQAEFGLPDGVLMAGRLLAEHPFGGAFPTSADLQARWAGRAGGPGPHEVLDWLGAVSEALAAEFARCDSDRGVACARYLFPDFNTVKLRENWSAVLAGASLGALVNENWGWVGSAYARPPKQLAFAFDQRAAYSPADGLETCLDV